MIAENASSVAHRDLPPASPASLLGGSIVLFYQYKEPEWDSKEHKKALKTVLELATQHEICGRGRVAPEGLNCTLSGSGAAVRAFCYALRAWDPLFDNTDFKITDGVPRAQLFKSLSVKKADELVAYGLRGGDKAPDLGKFAGTHLEADEYHAAMADKDSVIIDVRNAYESAIGSFQPPAGGAELIDPKMRNSIEFPKWLNDAATQEKLKGKKVLMYCTGGIRCERASALLNQMAAVNPEKLQLKGVYELRGGIERYIKTFPEGGNWVGKNYLFDRRMEQLPGSQNEADADKSVNACCCLCRKKWTVYRGHFNCSKSLCGVPVIVCDDCKERAHAQPKALSCELCREGYRAPMSQPDLVGLKRRAEAAVGGGEAAEAAAAEVSNKKTRTEGDEALVTCDDRLFLGRLPLATSLGKLRTALTPPQMDYVTGKEKEVTSANSAVRAVHWLADAASGAFYGSAVVRMKTAAAAQQAVTRAASEAGIKVDKKRVKVVFAKVRAEQLHDSFPPADVAQGEYPPIGH